MKRFTRQHRLLGNPQSVRLSDLIHETNVVPASDTLLLDFNGILDKWLIFSVSSIDRVLFNIISGKTVDTFDEGGLIVGIVAIRALAKGLSSSHSPGVQVSTS